MIVAALLERAAVVLAGGSLKDRLRYAFDRALKDAEKRGDEAVGDVERVGVVVFKRFVGINLPTHLSHEQISKAIDRIPDSRHEPWAKYMPWLFDRLVRIANDGSLGAMPARLYDGIVAYEKLLRKKETADRLASKDINQYKDAWDFIDDVTKAQNEALATQKKVISDDAGWTITEAWSKQALDTLAPRLEGGKTAVWCVARPHQNHFEHPQYAGSGKARFFVFEQKSSGDKWLAFFKDGTLEEIKDKSNLEVPSEAPVWDPLLDICERQGLHQQPKKKKAINADAVLSQYVLDVYSNPRTLEECLDACRLEPFILKFALGDMWGDASAAVLQSGQLHAVARAIESDFLERHPDYEVSGDIFDHLLRLINVTFRNKTFTIEEFQQSDIAWLGAGALPDLIEKARAKYPNRYSADVANFWLTSERLPAENGFPAHMFVDFGTGATAFTIRVDPESGALLEPITSQGSNG